MVAPLIRGWQQLDRCLELQVSRLCRSILISSARMGNRRTQVGGWTGRWAVDRQVSVHITRNATWIGSRWMSSAANKEVMEEIASLSSTAPGRKPSAFWGEKQGISARTTGAQHKVETQAWLPLDNSMTWHMSYGASFTTCNFLTESDDMQLCMLHLAVTPWREWDVGQQGHSQPCCHSCQVTGCSHREETQQQSTATSSSPPKQVGADKRSLVWFNLWQWGKKRCMQTSGVNITSRFAY